MHCAATADLATGQIERVHPEVVWPTLSTANRPTRSSFYRERYRPEYRQSTEYAARRGRPRARRVRRQWSYQERRFHRPSVWRDRRGQAAKPMADGNVVLGK